jgi:NAD(P)-dependent dehydrogenase (short-subunit alcohol dehydrogenase family)
MQTVLITGASSGFGRATAEKLAQLGYKVFGTSRRSGQSVPGAEMLVMDVQDEASVNRTVKTVMEQTGRLDVLINNAGIFLMGAAEETTEAQTRDLFETNFFGALRVMNAVLPVMREQRSGRIINVASIAGRMAVPGEASYAATKFALVGYSEALRHEVAPLGIHVSLIEPGFFKTNIEGAAIPAEKNIADYKEIRATVEAAIKRGFEKGRDAREVAALIAEVIKTPKPALHYPIGNEAGALNVKRFLPESLFEVGFKRSFGLDKMEPSATRNISKETA